MSDEITDSLQVQMNKEEQCSVTPLADTISITECQNMSISVENINKV